MIKGYACSHQESQGVTVTLGYVHYVKNQGGGCSIVNAKSQSFKAGQSFNYSRS